MSRTLLLWISFAFVAFLPLPALATPLLDGTYQLGNHPDGNAAEPFYGLRLDGLFDGDDDTIVTLSFDPADGANVQMTIDGAEIHIYGVVFGGEIANHAYVGGGHFFKLDFRYTDAVVSGMTHTANTGSGTITQMGGDAYDLVAYAGDHDDAFALAMGHRGVDGFSGFGWLIHGGAQEHLKASDWLFTVVPEPHAFGLMALGLAGLLWIGRRR
ncbi:MAG: PEP-CTERM sorting domain-containing protein [Myxococcota bacterium]|nr:PEP-CTERM sorting domain-containing protein [Myxococcota bacterium]